MSEPTETVEPAEFLAIARIMGFKALLRQYRHAPANAKPMIERAEGGYRLVARPEVEIGWRVEISAGTKPQIVTVVRKSGQGCLRAIHYRDRHGLPRKAYMGAILRILPSDDRVIE